MTIQKVGIWCNRNKAEALEAAERLIAALRTHGIGAGLDEELAARLPRAEAERGLDGSDLIVTLGGDGTLLSGIDEAMRLGAPMLGVNLGHVGFLTEIEPYQIRQAVARIAAGDYYEEERMLLKADGYEAFGLNDVSIGIWQTKEEYAQEYHEILDTLHETFPNAGIYVNSILPARDPAFNTSAKWYEIPDYSNAVKEMCEENGFSFVNNDDLAEQYSQYWEIDGIHLQKPFYPYWAANMMMTVYGEGLGDEE